MRGWKTWTAAVLYAAATVVETTFPEYKVIADAIRNVAIALGAIGIGHKIEKGGK